jgi:hypothetical protein
MYIEIKDSKICYEKCHCPTLKVNEKSENIDQNRYVAREKDDFIATYQKQGNNVTDSVNCCNGTCTCRHLMKTGYYKHLLHAHAFALLNVDSDCIIIDH